MDAITYQGGGWGVVPTPRGDRVCVYMGRDYFCSPSSLAHGWHGLLGFLAVSWRSRRGSSLGRRGNWSGEFRRGLLQCVSGRVLSWVAGRSPAITEGVISHGVHIQL